jgi:GNAT superfamily N-acetyltransferase
MELRAVRYDAPDVVALTEEVQAEYTVLYGGADASHVDPAQFDPPAGHFVVGYLDGRPVAMGGWRLLTAGESAPGRRPAELKRMYVVPKERGRGLSRLLLAGLESSARRAGVDWLVLESGQAQPAALSLYRSSGYAEVDGRFGYYFGSPLAVHLGKRLGQASPSLTA